MGNPDEEKGKLKRNIETSVCDTMLFSVAHESPLAHTCRFVQGVYFAFRHRGLLPTEKTI